MWQDRTAPPYYDDRMNISRNMCKGSNNSGDLIISNNFLIK